MRYTLLIGFMKYNLILKHLNVNVKLKYEKTPGDSKCIFYHWCDIKTRVKREKM